MQHHSKQLLALHRQSAPTPTTGPTVGFQAAAITGRDGGVSPDCLEKTTGGGEVDSYPQAGSCIDDDRITCNQCQHMVQAVQTVNMQAQDFDRIRRANHPANQWMFDIVKIRNGWARAEYMGWQCNGGQRSYIPIDIKHRCDNFKPKQNAVEVNVKEWWE